MKFHHHVAPAQNATQLWVMLPGAYMTPADFIAAGFIDAVRRRGLPHDISLLEASIAELADGTALHFLQDFLCSDAVAGTRRVCLVGISLGAHLAMRCLAGGPSDLQQHAAARVAAACLLAPYLGPRDIIAEAALGQAGRPQQPQALEDDADRRIWQWLQQRSGMDCEIHLGYGSEDRFAAAHALMARYLPASHVDLEPGAHTWTVWTSLWNRHLDHVHVR